MSCGATLPIWLEVLTFVVEVVNSILGGAPL